MINLNTISQSVNSKISDISGDSGRISESSIETKNLTQKNQESVDILLKEVSTFKIYDNG